MYSQKCAKDFRYEARTALSGNWWLAIGTTIVASILGLCTITSTVGSISSGSDSSAAVNDPAVLAVMMLISSISFIYTIITFVLSGPVTLGYIKFTMKAHNNEKPKFSDLFSQFNRFGEGFCVYALRLLYTFLWVLAAVAPVVIVGIPLVYVMGKFGLILMYLLAIAAGAFVAMKMYSYALAPYIVYDHPGIGAAAALRKSVDMMDGNKWRLFCLAFSFIGWNLLASVPAIIAVALESPALVFIATPITLAATVVIQTYMEFAYTAFYRDIAKSRDELYSPDEDRTSANSEFMAKLQGADSVVEQSNWKY